MQCPCCDAQPLLCMLKVALPTGNAFQTINALQKEGTAARRSRVAQTLLSWQATPLTEAALGARSLAVAQMLAPRPCSDAPGATVCQLCTAPGQA